MTDIHLLRARSFILVVESAGRLGNLCPTTAESWAAWRFSQLVYGRQSIRLGYLPASGAHASAAEVEWKHSTIRLVLGDDSEFDDAAADQCLGYAVTITIDRARAFVEAVTSIVGLPPIFHVRADGRVALASDISKLLQYTSATPQLDSDAILDVFSLGYPLHGHTMFRNISMLPAGHRLTVDANGNCQLQRCWDLPEWDYAHTLPDIVAEQADVFRQAVRKTSVQGAFLSLTAGLDTRAILAALLVDQRPIPAFTTTGYLPSIDSRTAQLLCNHYGLQHTSVVLGEDFLRDLPNYVLEASRLSGGICGLAQAHEVYSYRRVAHLGSRRLSGNLGNQVGRCGSEGNALRGADLRVLAPEFGFRNMPCPLPHWLPRAVSAGDSLLTVLLQQEVPYASVANYCIGQSFAVQLSPYAKSALISRATCTFRRPRTGRYSLFDARIRDLRHRFIGPHRGRSFQCLVVADAGGYVSTTAINWGWGVHSLPRPSSLVLGSAALLDVLAHSSMPVASLAGRLARHLGVTGIQEFAQPRRWLDLLLADFAQDLFRSATIRESGVFDYRQLLAHIEEHRSGKRRHYATLSAALDLAAAVTVFGAAL